MFRILKKSKKSHARIGVLKTKSGQVKTPFFMPIATKGAVKSLSFNDIEKLQPEVVLSNTYHIYLKPGLEVIKKFGNLNKFMNCKFPILTDSGGFQIFSLSKIRKIRQDGVEFVSVYDGSKHFFSPELVMKIQSILNSDIQMVLDVCLNSKSSKKELEKALEITTTWAKKCKKSKKKFDPNNKNLLFGIVQGGLHKDLRLKSLNNLLEIGFDGYAIGGLAVGETNKEMYEILKFLENKLPEKNPRYLMGVGYPENIVEAVKNGIDMFDCVIPTREARHGRLYFRKNDNLSGKFYETINISNSKYIKDISPINKNSKFQELQKYSKSYLSLIFKNQDPLAMRLMTINNLEFYVDLMKDIRNNILSGKF